MNFGFKLNLLSIRKLALYISALLGTVFAISAGAADGVTATSFSTHVQTKHWMDGALEIQITSRGMGIFKNQLDTIIANQGLSLDEGYPSKQHYRADSPIDVNSASIDPKMKQLIQEVNSTLADWLTGFPLLSKVQPVIDLGPSQYKAKFTKFSLRTAPEIKNIPIPQNSVVLELELEIQEIDLRSTQIRVWDDLHSKLGQVGFDQPQLSILAPGKPIIVKIPFLVTTDSQGLPIFQAFDVQQNLGQSNITFSYSKVIAPSIEVIINGQSYKMNQKQLNKTVSQNIPAEIAKLRNYLNTAASEDLPKLLNEKVRQNLVHAIEQVQTLIPPGTTAAVQPLLWGIKLNKQSLQQQDLNVTLSSYVEDPLNPNSSVRAAHSTGPAQFKELPESNYDVGFAMDIAMINRMMQLSFERGLFNQMSTSSMTVKKECVNPQLPAPSPNSVMQLLSAPQLLPIKSGSNSNALGETLVRLHLDLKVPQGTVNGFETMLINDGFRVNFDLIVKLQRDSTGRRILMYMWDTDPNSVALDSGSLTAAGNLAKGLIVNAIQSTFTKMAAQWRCNGNTLPGAIDVPKVMGVSLQIQHLIMENNGQFVLYLAYGK
jgi:hypothetical protein